MRNLHEQMRCYKSYHFLDLSVYYCVVLYLIRLHWVKHTELEETELASTGLEYPELVWVRLG